MLLVNAAYVYWDGGHSTGPRHAVPAIGLLAIGLATFWANRVYWWERAFAAAILGMSIAINLAIAAANITTPDEYKFPLWDPILKADWAGGVLRTLPSDFLGWSPFAGVALYLLLAIPLGLTFARARATKGTLMASLPALSHGFVLFPDMTQLDFTGPAQVLTRMGNTTIELVAKSLDPVMTDAGFTLQPTATFDTARMPDIFCVPGGFGVVPAMEDAETIAWVRAAGEQAQWVTAVCTGALLLGAAGLLNGYRATTHWASHHNLDCSARSRSTNAMCSTEPRDRRRSDRGDRLWAGADRCDPRPDHAKFVQLSVEYDPAAAVRRRLSGQGRARDPRSLQGDGRASRQRPRRANTRNRGKAQPFLTAFTRCQM